MDNKAMVGAIFEQFKIISELDVVDDMMLLARASKLVELFMYGEQIEIEYRGKTYVSERIIDTYKNCKGCVFNNGDKCNVYLKEKTWVCDRANGISLIWKLKGDKLKMMVCPKANKSCGHCNAMTPHAEDEKCGRDSCGRACKCIPVNEVAKEPLKECYTCAYPSTDTHCIGCRNFSKWMPKAKNDGPVKFTRIKVVKCSSSGFWYQACVNDSFDVVEYSDKDKWQHAREPLLLFEKCDCEIVNSVEPACSCGTGYNPECDAHHGYKEIEEISQSVIVNGVTVRHLAVKLNELIKDHMELKRSVNKFNKE